MGLSLVDASVLIATLNDDDAHQERARTELKATRQRHSLSIPAVAFSEALVLPCRRGDGRRVEDGLRRMGRVEPVTDAIASRAARLRARRRIKLPDALILATADELDAEEILTFDQQWRSIDPRVRVL